MLAENDNVLERTTIYDADRESVTHELYCVQGEPNIYLYEQIPYYSLLFLKYTVKIQDYTNAHVHRHIFISDNV